MSVGLVINFKDGVKRTKNQLHRLGIVVPDGAGDLWSYVQFAEDIAYGDVVRDAAGADLVANSGIGTLTAAGAVGTHLLKDTGEFAEDSDEWVVGAVGWVHEGPAQGSAFYVRKRIDDDTLEIEMLSTPSGRGGDGWPVPVSTATKYSLSLPGLVFKGTAAGITRGVAQAAAKSGEYGFVKQTRNAAVNIDADGAVLTRGQGLVPVADGLVAGYAGTPSGLNVDRRIGRWKFADLSGVANRHGWAHLMIDNDDISYRFPDEEVAFNRVNVS